MKVKELFSDASKWHQGYYAADVEGHRADADDPAAVCWCLVGAIQKCYMAGPVKWFEVRDIVNEHLPAEFDKGSSTRVVNYNDAPDRTFEEIKALVDALDI